MPVITEGSRLRATCILLAAVVVCGPIRAQETVQLSIEQTSIVLTIGDTTTVGLHVVGALRNELSKVVWTSDNDAVASVDRSGRVTARSPGITGITARIGNEFATTRVSVAQAAASAGNHVVTATAAVVSVGSSHPARGPESAGSLYSGYSSVSPHWPHIRTMMTDFYYKWTPSERSWAGAHYDYAMGGDAAAWKATNPKVQHYAYVLLQAVLVPRGEAGEDHAPGSYGDMRRWFSSHPQYNIESAFLHQAGQPSDAAHRLRPFGWDTYTWIINPADHGLIAYSTDRFQRSAMGHDGLFIDSQGSGDLMKNAKGSAEYPDVAKWPPVSSAYFSAYAELLGTLRKAIAPRLLMLNSGGYAFAPDSSNLTAAGATHMEKANNPLSSNLPSTWSWIDRLLRAGIFVDLVDALDYIDVKNLMRTKLPAPSIDSAYHRVKMGELASYYMVVPPTPDRIALQLVNTWDRPFSSIWLKAQEANIGHPTGVRHQMAQGVPPTDPAGQQVRVFERDFDRALVIFRPQIGWGKQDYSDSTSVTIPLPTSDTWLPLNADGSLGSPVTRVKLRNVEAAILIKQRTLH
jgi:hypothetical protein